MRYLRFAIGNAVFVLTLVFPRISAAQDIQAGPRAFHCLAFSPYVAGYSPVTGPHPPPYVIDRLLSDVVAKTDYRCILTYSVLNGQDHVFVAARRLKLKVIAIAWLNDNGHRNNESVARAIDYAAIYRDTIIRLGCGSEVRTRSGAKVAESVVGNCIARMRRAGVRQPIGTNESWWALCNERWPCAKWGLISRLDWIGTNVYAWWENKYSGLFPCITAQQAAAFHIARFQNVRATYSSRPVMLTEHGWPAGPNGYRETNRFTGQRCGVASPANQRLVVEATVKRLRTLNLPHVLFEAYRERWKIIEGRVGPWWGILNPPTSFR